MHRWWTCLAAAILVTGCGTHKSSLLLERNARGPIDEALSVGHPLEWKLAPVLQTQTHAGVEVTINQASRTFLDNFFANKKIFGAYAGHNPFSMANLVFYVKIANRGKDKIFVDPLGFVLVDDLGNQYSPISTDYVTAFKEASRSSLVSTARGMIEEARPGYFGVSVPIGKIVTAESQQPFALLKQSELQVGYLYPGVVHDGLVVFLNPSVNATKIRFIMTNIRTDYKPDNLPETAFDFPFEFTATK